MSKPQIEVEIDEQGNSTVSVTGVSGSDCKALTDDIEKALGKVTDTCKTRDYAKGGKSQHLKA